MKKLILLIEIILISFHAYSADNRRITWEPVPGAWGYFLEIRDASDMVIVSTNITNNYYAISELEPGKYSFRIATVNIMKQTGESTSWLNFSVEKLITPELKSISVKVLVSSVKNKNIIVRGKNFNPDSRFILVGNGKEITISDVNISSDQEAVLIYKPDSSLKGVFDFVVRNRGDAEATIKNAVEIVEPSKAPTRIYLGAGCMMNIINGTWNKYFESSYTGGYLSFQVSGENIGLENIRFEIECEGAYFKSKSSLSKKSSLTYASLGGGIGYYYPMDILPLELFLKLQGGLVYDILMLDESLIQKKNTSADLFAGGAAGVRLYPGDSVFIETSCLWKTVLFKESYFNAIGVTLGTGIRF